MSKYCEREEFWRKMENVKCPPGRRPMICVEVQQFYTLTEVKVGSRVYGETAADHQSGVTRCYLHEEA